MEIKPFIRLFFSLLIILVIIAISGCETPVSEDFTAWTHTIVAENYTGASDPYVYTITDARFNTDDWYDIWMDDVDPLGWSSFEGIWDTAVSRFYYEPEYYNGYVEWNSYTNTAIIGQTLRFYRRKHP